MSDNAKGAERDSELVQREYPGNQTVSSRETRYEGSASSSEGFRHFVNDTETIAGKSCPIKGVLKWQCRAC